MRWKEKNLSKNYSNPIKMEEKEREGSFFVKENRRKYWKNTGKYR